MLRYQRALLQIAIFIIGSGWLASTQSMAAEGPSLDELKGALRQYLPSHISIETFVVEASQNIRTAVEPVMTGRIKTTLQIKEALHIERQPFQGTPVIAEHSKAGTTNETWYISRAELLKGKWQINFRPQGDEFFRMGSPRAKYAANALLEHSTEYNAHVANMQEQARQQAARLQASQIPSKVLHTFKFTTKNMMGNPVSSQITIRDVNFEYVNINSGGVKDHQTIWFGHFVGSRPDEFGNAKLGKWPGWSTTITTGRKEDGQIVSRALNEALAAWKVKYPELVYGNDH